RAELKCYDELGCLETGGAFFDEIRRPFVLTPHDRDMIKVRYLLYTRDRPEATMLCWNSSLETVRDSPFNASRPTKFIVHGYLDTVYFGAWMTEMKDAYLKNADMNVFIVDWSGGNGPAYETAVVNARIAGAEIALLVRKLEVAFGANASTMHIIGHSLGAHVAGYAGHNITRLGRITALDPAEPFFEGMPHEVRVDRSDADFVDVIHTDSHPYLSKLDMGLDLGRQDKGGDELVQCEGCGRWCYLEETGFGSLEEAKGMSFECRLCVKLQQVTGEWEGRVREIEAELKAEGEKRVGLEAQVEELTRQLNHEREQRVGLEKQVEELGEVWKAGLEECKRECDSRVERLEGVIRASESSEGRKEEVSVLAGRTAGPQAGVAGGQESSLLNDGLDDAGELSDPQLNSAFEQQASGSQVTADKSQDKGAQVPGGSRVLVVGSSNVARVKRGVLNRVKRDQRVTVEVQPGKCMVDAMTAARVRDIVSCHHQRAVHYMLDSIENQNCVPLSFECSSYEAFKKGQCRDCGEDGSACAPMGEQADVWRPHKQDRERRMYGDTNAHKPFCAYQYLVTVRTGDQVKRANAEGTISLTTKQGGKSVTFKVNKRFMEFRPNSTYTFLTTSPAMISDYTKLALRFKSTLFFTTANLPLLDLQIQPLTANVPKSMVKAATRRFCPPWDPQGIGSFETVTLKKC
ncbi:hypothetical protein HPB47_001917, partial [Ixodes persulcatus]